MTPFKDRFNTIVKEYFVPFLSSRGFKKKRNVFIRPISNEMEWMIDIQKSNWSSPEKASFTYDVGVHIPEVISIYFDQPPPKIVGIVDCPVRARVSTLTSVGESWWDFKKDESYDKNMGVRIQEQLEKGALPFLEQFLTTHQVLDFLGTPRTRKNRHIWPQSEVISLAYSGIIHFQSGAFEKMKSALEQAVELDFGKPGQKIIESLTNRLMDPQEFPGQ